MSNKVFQQNLDDKKGPQPGGPYLIQMLFKEPVEMPDKEKMTAIMEKHIGSTECFCYDKKMAGFAAQEHIAEFKDGKCPVQLMVTKCDKFKGKGFDAFLMSQMWDCQEDRERIFRECKYQVVATDMLAAALPALERANLDADFLEALAELYPTCEAFYFQNCGKLFLAEETIEKFSEVKIQKVQKKKLDIVYEDEHILLINKPSGMLSQKAKETDESLVEYLIDYLLDSGKLKKEDLACFRPSVCNRLDRNTSGIVAAGRSLPGLQIMSEVIKDRSLGKYYVCVVRGIVKGEARIEGWLTKNEKTNQVSIRKEETPGSLPIRTAYRPLASGNGYTLLEVHLITGRSHQIRAHLASIGHPIAGDPKYGDPRVNEEVKKRFGVRSQMLHAWRLVMPETISEPLSYLAGKEFTAPMPAEMKRMEEMMKSAPKRPANHRL